MNTAQLCPVNVSLIFRKNISQDKRPNVIKYNEMLNSDDYAILRTLKWLGPQWEYFT